LPTQPGPAPGTVPVGGGEYERFVGTSLGPYRIVRFMAQGGMGAVFEAEQRHPVYRRTAVKMIRPGLNMPETLARFDVERQALALMDHPNIARVLDAGVAGWGEPYVVLEYVEGQAITHHCDCIKLSIRQRLQLFLSVCDAVEHAHTKGIIHR